MRAKRILGAVAAALLAVSFAGSAMAVGPNTANVSLTITPGSTLTVEITDSNNFPNQPFNLNAAPGNYAYSAHYNLQVVDGRGTGAGWNVTASATHFTPAVAGDGLPTVNNGLYWIPCAAATGICALPGSTAGAQLTAGSPDIIAGGASIMYGEAGSILPGPLPKSTGTYQTQEVVYYTGFPPAIQAGTYTTTITLTIAGVYP